MPEQDRNAPDAERDLAACENLLRDGSRSFLAASRILPRQTARAACALYAFCRLADDSIDGERHEGALTQLRERLELIYSGTPRALPADRAFAAVVARYRMPRAWPQALLEGFEWDASGRQYEDLPQLYAYAARVAGSVGAMMARVMGVQARAVLARACELGVAMQLTNIARDVGEDAFAGRLYLPRDWLRQAGIDPDAWLARPCFSAELGGVVARLLDEARCRYRGGAAGLSGLPMGCRPGIRAAALLYADIGRAVELAGFDSIGARAVVGPGRKAQLLAMAALAWIVPAYPAEAATLREIEFLLDAPGACASAFPARQSSVDFMLGLFERLERRDQAFANHLGTAATTPSPGAS